ncbi:trimeric intracellular cation channel family protein [Paeniroseomonas aquatica]
MIGVETLLRWLDLAGIAVFAASGALVASRKQMDAVGFILVAAVTGFGGGTLRDLLLGRLPVVWLRDPALLAVASSVALLVFFTAHRIENRFRALLWADALGLSLFAVLGAETALIAGANPWAAVLLGVVTASFGGALRDVVCNEIPLLLRKEIYALAALAGAAVFVGLRLHGVWRDPALLGGMAVCFGIRAAAIARGWSLPAYKGRPGREHPDRG